MEWGSPFCHAAFHHYCAQAKSARFPPNFSDPIHPPFLFDFSSHPSPCRHFSNAGRKQKRSEHESVLFHDTQRFRLRHIRHGSEASTTKQEARKGCTQRQILLHIYRNFRALPIPTTEASPTVFFQCSPLPNTLFSFCNPQLTAKASKWEHVIPS